MLVINLHNHNLSHRTLPHPHSCLTHVRPLPQHPPSPSLVFNMCEASLPQSPSHINLVCFLVAYRPSSLVFNAFEALRHPPSLPTIVAYLHFPPLSPTFVAHHCCPPLLPTIVAHCRCPLSLPTVVTHHRHPPSSPTFVTHLRPSSRLIRDKCYSPKPVL